MKLSMIGITMTTCSKFTNHCSRTTATISEVYLEEEMEQIHYQTSTTTITEDSIHWTETVAIFYIHSSSNSSNEYY